MSAYDLSILIPARSEQFLANTVADILKNKRGKTEVIVVCDGSWADPSIEDHDDVRIIYLPEARGQRASQNMAARLSTAKYVAKTDAHCAFSEGFDVELMKTFGELGEDIVVAPLMKNLHAFDWKCMKCGKRTYQGPKPVSCEDCDNTDDFTQRIVFKPRHRTPNSTSYRFDSNLHFQYFNEYKEKQVGDLVESMSLQGSFFMCTREKYWELTLCDETWGSWGQQGSEVALKTWLSGGRVIINKRCWYAHLFRTQAGFSFPYPQSGSAQQRARDICNDIFKNNKWEHQVKPLSWLVEKFSPVPEWGEAALAQIQEAGEKFYVK
jgi:glycosyltransferase involved in cell wall biosynthesis